MFRALISSALIVWSAPVAAQDAAALGDALLLPETVEILREEGLSYTQDLAADLFTGAPSAVWTEAVDAIFDEMILLDGLRDTLAAGLSPEAAGAAIAFYTSEPGAQIARLELAARRALLDETVEETAIREVGDALRDREPQAIRMRDYVDRVGMIEEETASAMTLSLAFTNGLRDGGALGAVDEAAILRDLYDRVPQIRQDVTERIYAYFWLAYGPLEEKTIETYLAFLEGEDGTALMEATFAAYDAVYMQASRQLGLVAASQMRGSDL